MNVAMSQRNDSIITIPPHTLQRQEKLCGVSDEFSRLFPGIEFTARLIQVLKSCDREGHH